MSKSVEISFDDESGGNELGEYLIQREKSQNNNSVTGFFSNVGTNVQKMLPKRMGTGSIEDDIAVRFGLRSGGGIATDSSGVSNESGGGGGGYGFSLSRKERIVGFFVLLGMGLLFFTLSSFYIPVLIFQARKFSIFFTLGSLCTLSSLSVLWGVSAFLRHLISKDRIIFTALYCGSLVATLYFSIGLQSTLLTIIGIVFQVLSLVSFIISYLPGGIAGITNLCKFVSSSLTRSIPI